MKDIMQKLAELEATAPKVTKKKMLNEDSTTPPMNVSDKPASLKDIFETMAMQKPIPVVGKQGDTAQTGAGFLNVTDNSPAAQALGNALADLAGQKKVQIVMPTQPGQPNQAGATGQPQMGQMQMKEKDEGKPGKNFAKIAKSAGKRYGSKEAGERVAGAVRAKLAKQGKLEEEQLDELSPKTLKSYAKKADIDHAVTNRELKNRYHTGLDPELMRKSSNRTQGMKLAGDKMMGRAKVPATEGAKVDRMVKHIEKSEEKLGKSKEEAQDIAWATANKRGMLDNKNKKKTNESSETEYRVLGQYDKKTSKGYDTRPVSVKVKASSEKEAKELAKEQLAHNHKNYRPTRVEALTSNVKEGDIPSSSGVDTRGAGLGAGRSQTTLEGAKPDFLDLDKDGNKKEPMKKAAADKKKKKVDESMNHRISAARLEGKSHGLRGHAHSGKRYEDLEEMKAYHEGYKEGLDECYGQGVYEGLAGTAGGAIAGGMLGGPLGAVAGGLLGSELSKESAPATPPATVGGMADAAMDEGNAFTAALAKTPKGGKFSVGGKTFTDNSNLEEYAFEAWDRELSNLLNESEEVTEGMSVSISKGQQNSPDSVTITAQDQEADELLAFVKQAGLGLFGADKEPSSAMSIQPSHGAADEVGAGGVDVEVVDGHDGIMGLMQKLSGIQSAGHADEDYADEEGHKDCGCSGDCDCNEKTNEDMCNECGTYEGMHEAGCSMGKGKEMVDEVESEDQMEFEVAEDNAPDSEEAEHTADEDAEAQEDMALAKAAQQDKTTTVNEGGDGGEASEEGPESKEGETDEEGETVSESFMNLFKKLAFIAEESTAEKDDKAEKAAKKVAKDIEYDEGHKGKDDNKAEKAGEKVKKDIEYDDKKDKKEKVDEWANNAGPGKTVSDTTFEQDIDFMTKVIAGGLNKPKSTGQTTIPVIAGQEDRMHDNPMDWATLAGIKK